MTWWQRTLANLASSLVCLGILVSQAACGTGAGVPPSAPVPAQAQAAPQDSIPAHVRQTLAYVQKHGYAPPGYVGGRIFGNYEGLLPRYNVRRKRIEYREWDVHPKAEGRTRGGERLVTGDDGRVWYSRDHYRTFSEVK
jgi:guanyl-specific ribonuclease Sa